MRIEKVQSPNFGYDAQLNKQVIEKLSAAKHSRPFFDTLLKINELTNQTEDMMRITHASGNNALTYKLEDAFLT